MVLQAFVSGHVGVSPAHHDENHPKHSDRKGSYSSEDWPSSRLFSRSYSIAAPCSWLFKVKVSGPSSAASCSRRLPGPPWSIILSPWRPSLVFDRRLLRPIIAFGIPYQLKNVIGFINGAITPIYAGRTLGTTALGYITWAQTTGFLPVKIVEIIGRVTFPLFSRLVIDHATFAQDYRPFHLDLCPWYFLPGRAFLRARSYSGTGGLVDKFPIRCSASLCLYPGYYHRLYITNSWRGPGCCRTAPDLCPPSLLLDTAQGLDNRGLRHSPLGDYRFFGGVLCTRDPGQYRSVNSYA